MTDMKPSPPFLVKKERRVHVFMVNRLPTEVFLGTDEQAKQRYDFILHKAYLEWRKLQSDPEAATKDVYLTHFRWFPATYKLVEPDG